MQLALEMKLMDKITEEKILLGKKIWQKIEIGVKT